VTNQALLSQRRLRLRCAAGCTAFWPCTHLTETALLRVPPRGCGCGHGGVTMGQAVGQRWRRRRGIIDGCYVLRLLDGGGAGSWKTHGVSSPCWPTALLGAGAREGRRTAARPWCASAPEGGLVNQRHHGAAPRPLLPPARLRKLALDPRPLLIPARSHANSSGLTSNV